MIARTITINLAPVLTLWAAVVAERLGFDHDEALTLGRAVAGLTAYVKGKSIGLFEPSPESVKQKRQEQEGGFTVALLGRAIPVVATPEGIRATAKGKPQKPDGVERYLAKAFGDDLPTATDAMVKLAKAYEAVRLNATGFAFYEQFQPVPSGATGWGAKGKLDLGKIEALTGR